MTKLKVYEELYDEYMDMVCSPKTAEQLLIEIKNTVDPKDYHKMVVFIDGTADSVAIANEIRNLSDLKGGYEEEVPLKDVEDPEEYLCAVVDPTSLPQNGVFIYGNNLNMTKNKYWTIRDMINELSKLNPEEPIFYAHIPDELYCGDGDLNNSLSVIENITTSTKYVDEHGDDSFIHDNDDHGNEIEVLISNYDIGLVVWVFTIISNITI